MQPESSLPCSQVRILSEINPVHMTASYFSKTDFNIILPPMSWSS
jgi:hypothetical protein